MSPSSDIETLFGHFGGNAGDYQEIGRENEASTARTRWPLLVTLDLTQPPIPAIAQRREPLSKPAGEAGQTQAVESDKPEAPVSAGPALTGPALLRSKAPLFSRPHRRNIPPVANVVKADAPRGAERFSALPQVAVPEAAASQAPEPVAGPPVAAATPIPPVVAPTARLFASSASSVKPTVSTGLAAPVAPRVQSPLSNSSGLAAPLTRAAVQAPAAPPVQPGTILGQLFKPAARNPAPSATAPAAQGAAPLASLFDRLRGEAPTAAKPAPHSWLTNGPRRS